MKQCKLCNKLKDESEFGENKMLPDGLQAACRLCVKKLQDSPRMVGTQANKIITWPCCR